MTRVRLVTADNTDDPMVREILNWVTEMEGKVPNHFHVELNFPEFFKAKLGATKVLWECGELKMEEIQHIGILVSQANGCPYCTGAFCTILNYGLGREQNYVEDLLANGVEVVDGERLRTLLHFALKVNNDAKQIDDNDIAALRSIDLTDKGIVQLIHVVSDFGSYNRLNLALSTDYDYQDLWKQGF